MTLTHLFFLEYDPVEEELQILICIINAELFEAVEGQILEFPHKRHTCTHSYSQQVIPEAALSLIYM